VAWRRRAAPTVDCEVEVSSRQPLAGDGVSWRWSVGVAAPRKLTVVGLGKG